MGRKKSSEIIWREHPPAPAITPSSCHCVELSTVEAAGSLCVPKIRGKDFSTLLTPIFWVCFSYKEQTYPLFRNYHIYVFF